MKKLLIITLVIIWFWWFSLASTQLDEAISRMNQKGLTKFDNTTDFMTTNWLRRDEASKFFVQYAKEVMWLSPDTSKTSCNFSDLSQARPDLKDLIKESCQLWLFQWHNWKFMPTQSLTNAQAITVLIRMIDWKKDETQWHFAQKYFEKAQELWIMNWLWLSSTAGFDKLATRWEIWILIYQTKNVLNIPVNTNNDESLENNDEHIDEHIDYIISWDFSYPIGYDWPMTISPENIPQCNSSQHLKYSNPPWSAQCENNIYRYTDMYSTTLECVWSGSMWTWSFKCGAISCNVPEMTIINNHCSCPEGYIYNCNGSCIPKINNHPTLPQCILW